MIQAADKPQSLLSIVIPVYNVACYLDDCLNPLRDCADTVQLLLVNDGSTDDSLQILNAYAATRANTVVIDQTNAGLSAARNSGMLQATGRYLFFLDSDDIARPQQLLDACHLAEQLTLDIVQCQAEVFKGSDTLRLLRPAKHRRQHQVLSGAEYYLKHAAAGEFPIPVWNNIFDREFLCRHKLVFIDGIIHEDEDFTPRAFMYAQRAAFNDSVIYRYRVRDDSITGTHRFSNANTIPSFLQISRQYIALKRATTLSPMQQRLLNRVLIQCYAKISRCFSAQNELLPSEITAQVLSNNRNLRAAIPHWWLNTRLLRYCLKNRKLGIE